MIKAIGGVVGFGAAIVGLVTLFKQMEKNRAEREAATRQQAEDLKWRRTEFLFRTMKALDDDLTLRPCVRLVDAGERDPQLALILKSDPLDLSDGYAQVRFHFDRYFDLLQMLAYAETKRTLELDEVSCFGWHFRRILEVPALKEYCSNNGYPDVVVLAQKLKTKGSF